MTSTVCEEFPRLAGRQEPHHLSVFPGDTTLGEKAITLGGRARKKTFPWQRDSLRAMMSRTPDGMWTHPECCLVVPRQNGKTLIIVLRILWGLFLGKERIVYSAQRWATSEDVYNRLWAIIDARPTLRDRVKNHTCSQGRGYIEVRGGGKIALVTRSADLGRGFDEVDLVVYDEAYSLIAAMILALSPTQLASSNPQTIYASSAVNEEMMPNGHVLTGMRERGLAGEPELYYAEWMAPPEMDRAAVATWEYANPSFGMIHTVAKVTKLFREASGTADLRAGFDCDVLGRGRWPKVIDGVPPVITPQMREAIVDQGAEVSGAIVLAVSVTPLGDIGPQMVTIAAGVRTTAGRIHAEVGYHLPLTPGVYEVISSLVRRWRPAALVVDGVDPAMSLVPDLLKLGIEPEVTNVRQMVQACGQLHANCNPAAPVISTTGDPLISDAMADGKKREIRGGGWAWQQGNGVLVAVTLVCWGLVMFEHRSVGAPPTPELVPMDDGSADDLGVFDYSAVGF